MLTIANIARAPSIVVGMARVEWLDDDEQAAWRAFVGSVVDLMAALEADVLPHELTMGDYQVLVYLSEAEGRAMRMCDLATHLQLSPSGLTRRLDGLVRGGLVERRASSADRRVMLAVLTRTGLRALERAAPTHVRSVRRHLIDRLERRDLSAMTRIFQAVRAGLDDDGAAAVPAAS
ncbi:MarR family transcriptional regulator [soil metagenome]